ncbi:MAG: DUF1599 domain-containing protein [Chitinophagaceae bacterium]
MNLKNTDLQFDSAVAACKEIFLQKAKDYGTAWRVLRTISVVDQIFIKALRIRNIQQIKEQKISDNISSELKGIINYAVIGLIQLHLNKPAVEELPIEKVEGWFDEQIAIAKKIMKDKNHDYGEAWRGMSSESFVDLILMKLMRIKQILLNEGKTLISEGIDANYIDIINYAIFALIIADES